MKPLLGIFDSGVGGLTVLNRVIERHGHVSCLYLGDNARVPYGERKPPEIRSIAKEIVQWLSDQGVTAVLVACNTTNSLALDVVERVSAVPVLSLIKAAAEMITEDRVGILAPPATATSRAYKHQIQAFKPNTIVFEQGCPEFVPMIEAGQLCSDEIRMIASEHLKPLLDVLTVPPPYKDNY